MNCLDAQDFENNLENITNFLVVLSENTYLHLYGICLQRSLNYNFTQRNLSTCIELGRHPFTFQGFPLGHHLCCPPALQQQSLSHARSIKVFDIQYSTDPEVGF